MNNELIDPKLTADESFEKKKVVRMVYGPGSKLAKFWDCTRCGVNLLDVPKGFYCATCEWRAE